MQVDEQDSAKCYTKEQNDAKRNIMSAELSSDPINLLWRLFMKVSLTQKGFKTV